MILRGFGVFAALAAMTDLTSAASAANVINFDLAGVTLGMTPESARAALIAKGFKPVVDESMQDSWNALLAAQMRERGVKSDDTSKVPAFTVAKGTQGERIEVWYTPTREGPRATSITYRIPHERMEEDTFIRGVESKYGKASITNGRYHFYCSNQENACSPPIAEYPYLSAIKDTMLTIYLDIGTAYRQNFKAERAAELEKLAPKNATATF